MVETSGMLKGGSSAFQRPYSFCFSFSMVSGEFYKIVEDMNPMGGFTRTIWKRGGDPAEG